MRKKIFLAILFWLLFLSNLAQKLSLDDYNVRWVTPGINSQGSMPIGNGDIGANTWVEENGDLVFYISKTDAWSNIGTLLKLGKVKVSISPNPFSEKTFFQELKLQNGEIFINYGNTNIRFWVDAHHSTIQVDVQSKTPVNVKITYENWRKHRRLLKGNIGMGVWGIGEKQVSEDCDKEVYEEADSIVLNRNGKIVAFHHNINSIWKRNLQIQSLSDVINSQNDPLLNRNFGLIITGKGLKNIADTVLASNKAAKNFQINVFALTEIGSVNHWRQKIEANAKKVLAIASEKRQEAHKAWWHQFWNRSYIYITSKNVQDRKDAESVTQGYILQRYINACAGRGNSPIKFNGSIFTIDTYNRKGNYSGLDADFRLWGGCYWWQNTRLPYWSMLVSGDADLMQPLFKMYISALPLRKTATKKYYGHDGAFFPETMNFWGTYADGDYGCDRTNLVDGYVKNPYIRYYWQSGLELSLIMADYYSFTKSAAFAKDTLIPFVSEILTFYNQHWNCGKDGKILFDPAMSLETFHSAVNPLPEIIGIRVVAEKMLQLPLQWLTSGKIAEFKKLINDLPAVPLRTVNGNTLLSPAHQYSNKANSENPEMYAVFPYRAYGLGKPDLEIAKRTFAAKVHKENGGWQQNSIQAAYLGLTEDAKRMVVENFSKWDTNFRFQAFWGPNYDWTPDQCHGNVAMIALQRMLLQYESDDVTLLPAWPKEWDVRFKLKGPDKKIYAGDYKNGKLKKVHTNK